MNVRRAIQGWLAVMLLAVLAAPPLAHAQSTITVDAYLHGSGGRANPPTLTADLQPSISLTTKTKDSASLAFSGGNPWKIIGNWVPPAGSSASIKLSALTTNHLWLGLRASGDVGGKVDLLAEIVVNGQVLSSGMTRCISTLTASSSTPQDIATTFSAIPLTAIDPATDTLAIRYSARMGTNTNGTACGTKASVTGVRAYFDSLLRLSRAGITIQLPPPTPVALLPNPRTIHAGATGALTAILFPAPLQAGTLTVMSSHPAVATVPASIPVGTLQFFVPITVTGVSAGTSVITVTMNGKSAMSTVRVTGGVATITSLTPPAMSITQGGTGQLTVTINAVQSTNTVVSLTSSAASVASVPATVTVLAGQTTASVPVAANTVGQADVTASLNGTSATSHVTVTSVLPTVVSLLPPTSQVTIGSSGTLAVTISAAQATNQTVTLSAAPTGVVTVSSTVIVPANQTSATVQVTGATLGITMVTASLNGSTATAAVDVIPPTVQLTDLQPPTQNLVVGAIGTLTVNINAQQSSPTIVTLAVDQPAVLQVPATVTVQPNQTQASFTVTALTVGTVQLTATLGAVTKQATVVVTPQPPSVTALIPTTLDVVQGATGSLTLRINAAQQTDTIVLLTNSSATILDVPPSATIPAGFTETPVQVTGLALGTATVTATLNGTVSSTITVVPPPVTIIALGPVPPTTPPLTLAKGRIGVLRVTVNRVPLDPTIVSLSNSATSLVTVPPTVTVPAGALFADFPVTTENEGTTTIAATLNSTSASAQVVVTVPEVDAIAVTPANPTVFATETVQFTTTATMTDGTTQPLTTGVTWTSTNTTVATIDSTGLATTLTAWTTTIKAATTNSLGPVTGETTLTVQTPPLLTFTPATATLQVGVNLNLTITSGAQAPAGDLLVTLTQTGSGSVTVVPSVTIPATQTSASVVVTGATLGSVTLTVSAVGRTSGSATLTIEPGSPNITNISPLTGPAGTVVTITGTSFNPTAANNQIKFNGVSAIIGTVNAAGTALTTTVPQGATTGSVTVTTLVAPPATGPTFTVAAPNFTVAALPTPLTMPALGQGSFAVGLTGTGGFTNLATLAVTGLPTGMTGLFSIGAIGSGQTALLTLTTTGTTPTGTYPLVVTATGALNGVTTPRSVTVNVQVLATGETTFSGLVLDEEDKPVKGALVKIGVVQVVTDDGGNFLIQNPPVGANQILFIDGGPASTPQHNLPIIPYKVTIVAGQANALSFVPHLHFQKTTGLVDISNAGVERVVTDPELPGFQMRIPAGATIIGWDGQPNTQMSVRRVPIDRIPVPPPPAGLFSTAAYMDYFGKPGGGTPIEPIPVTLPNDLDLPPGAQTQLWYFDEAPDGSRPNQWAQYGTGTVSDDGSQIVPDIDPATGKQYGQPRFCCGINMAAIIEATRQFYFGGGSPSPSKKTGGDPVDLATGLLTVSKTDMVLPGRLPIALTRTYQTNGTATGPFGRGTTHAALAAVLVEGNQRIMRLGDNLRLVLTLQSDGTYRNTTDPILQSAVMTEPSGTPTLRWKDGTRWVFGTSVNLLTRVLTQQIDRNGNTITNTWNGVNITAITGPDGRQLALDYDGAGRVTRTSDPIGRAVLYAYDGQGNLATVTDPEGGTTRYEYDSLNRMTRITDARNIVYLQNFYGPSGRVLRQVQADGAEYRFRYQLAGGTASGAGCTVLNPPTGTILASITLPFVPCPTVDSWENLQAGYTITGGAVTETTLVDPRGNVTTTRFNTRGYSTSTTDALGQTSAVQLNAANQVITSIDALGRTTRFEYDAQGNVTKITDPNNQPTRFEYHPTFNRVTKITDAVNQLTEFTYDATNGNLLTVKDPRLQVTTIAYNSFGQPLSVQGPIATEPPTTFAYDTNGNLITTTDPLGNNTQRVYDAVSRLTSLTDPRGLSTLFRYDGLNRVTEIADARQGITRFNYDPNGNLLSVQDAKGQATSYTYDSMDRLSTRRDALNRPESYQYDLAGNLSQFTDRKNQVTTFIYDPLNRRTTATYPDSTTSFIYDSVGQLTKASDTATGAGTIDFAYDTLDRLIQEVTGQGSVSYQYDVLGRRTQMIANGQQPVTYGYDAASRLTQVAQGTLAVGLGYDNANRRTSLTYPNNTSTSYTYNVASRLTNITHLGPSGIIEALTYQYDAAGNRTSLTRNNGAASLLPSAVASATYDAANEQTAFAGAMLHYDANGNLTNDGVNVYQWDARNRLTGISGGVTGSFNYMMGRRVAKTVTGVTTQYLYDGIDAIAEIGGGAVGANYLRSLSFDEPFIRQTATGNEHYHTDALGSSLALSNAQGGSSTSYSYEPFGKTTIAGSSSNPFEFTNREDDGTGVYYYRARYYSSKFQRFLGEDPLGLGGGDINLYAYVRNAPTQFTDPQGLYLGPWHYAMSFYAAWAEGCTLKASHTIASADVATDTKFKAFNPELAYIHGQTPPRMSTVEAILAANQFVIDQLKTDSLKGLGHALHATEDPQAGGHLWTPYSGNPSSWSQYVTQAPYWAEHVFYDIYPQGIGESIARDRAVIKRYKDLSNRKPQGCQ